MTYVITRKWSRYYDQTTGTQMDPVCVTDTKDPSFGCFIAAASIPDDKGVKKALAALDGLEVITDAAYAALTSTAPVAPPALDGDPSLNAAIRANTNAVTPPQQPDLPPAVTPAS